MGPQGSANYWGEFAERLYETSLHVISTYIRPAWLQNVATSQRGFLTVGLNQIKRTKKTLATYGEV